MCSGGDSENGEDKKRLDQFLTLFVELMVLALLEFERLILRSFKLKSVFVFYSPIFLRI